MAKNPNKLVQSQQIICDVDLADFSNDLSNDADIIEKAASSVKMIVFGLAGIPLVLILAWCMLIKASLAIPCIFVVGFFALAYPGLGSQSECFNLLGLNSILKERRRKMVEVRVALLESETGGISQFSKDVSLDRLSASEAEDWVKVLKQSAEGERISDTETYLSLLREVRSNLLSRNAKAKKEALEAELNSLS